MKEPQDIQAAPWGADTALAILQVFAQQHDLKAERIKPIRIGMNAIYLYADLNLVLRVHHPSKTLNDVEIEVNTAKFLHQNSFNTIRISDSFPDIYPIKHCYITVWSYLPSEQRPKDVAEDFGCMLKTFHRVMSNCDFSLPDFAPLSMIKQRVDMLKSLPHVDETVINALDEELRKIVQEADGIRFLFSKSAIHGDAHTGNIIWSNNEIFLLDYEAVSLGYRDYDLIPMCVIAKRFKPETRIDTFLNAYLQGLTLDHIDKRLIRIRELFMLSWLCQSMGRSDKADNEIKHRVYTLQANEEDVLWHPM